MYFQEYPVLLRGGGDLATGIAYRLHKAGFPRTVALATAIHEGEVTIEEIHARRATSPADAEEIAHTTGSIPVIAAPDLAPLLAKLQSPIAILIDARMAKRNIDTGKDQALRPGSIATPSSKRCAVTGWDASSGKVRRCPTPAPPA